MLGHINKRPRMKEGAWPGEIVASESPVHSWTRWMCSRRRRRDEYRWTCRGHSLKAHRCCLE